MRRITIWFGVALFAFVVGVATALSWYLYRQPTIVKLEEPSTRTRQIPKEILNAQEVQFCELIRQPENYRNSLVRVRAIYSVGMETSMPDSLGCRSEENAVWAEFESEEALTDSEQLVRAVSTIGSNRYGGQAEVVVVGKIEGASKEGYGHLNGFQYKFVIFRLEEAKAAPEGAAR